MGSSLSIRLGIRRSLTAAIVGAVCAALPADAATDHGLFRCRPAPAPLGETCRVEPHGTDLTSSTPLAPEVLSPPEASIESTESTSSWTETTDSLLRRLLELEIARADRDAHVDAERSPLVANEQAPLSFHRLIEHPDRAHAAAFLRDQMERNLRHVEAQAAIRSVVLDLRAGRVDDEIVRGLVDLSDTIHARAVIPREPSQVLDELRTERLHDRLTAALERDALTHEPIASDARISSGIATASATNTGVNASQGARSFANRALGLRYYFAPECTHCAALTPVVETLARRYGPSLAIVGIPVPLDARSTPPERVRAYRQRFTLTFPIEERPTAIAKAIAEDGVEAVPSLVAIVPAPPNGTAEANPIHVRLPSPQTLPQIERALAQILEATTAASSTTTSSSLAGGPT